MRYIEYQEYLGIGGNCDVTAFNRHIDRACGVIDGATFNRVENMSEIPQAVKACCRDLLEYMAHYSLSDTAVSSRSQTAGSVSESESYVTKNAEDMYNDIQSLLNDYLYSLKDDNGTPLLYKGAMR